MRYLDVVLYAFTKFFIWYSVAILLGIAIAEVSTCPEEARFMASGQSGAIYLCDRQGIIARSNASLGSHPISQ